VGYSNLGYGVLSCYCSRFPIVAGIPVLKKYSRTTEKVIALIEARKYQEALFGLVPIAERYTTPLLSSRRLRWLHRITYKRWARKSIDEVHALLTNKGGQTTACDLFDYVWHGKRENYNYNAFRFGQPRHLVALSFASLIQRPRKPVLDLACGCGQVTSSLVRRAGRQLVIGVDSFFFGLYIAKNWVAPEAEYVCCDAEMALPFWDRTFAIAFCSDAFHYIVNKSNCMRELKRLTEDKGLLIVTWVHNALQRRPHDGIPLPPEGYQALVADMPHRIVADDDILNRYLEKKGPALAGLTMLQDVAERPLISVVASRDEEVFRDYGVFEKWPHADGFLTLNPLYRQNGPATDGRTHLRRVFPSDFFKSDHAESERYLPETVNVPIEILSSLTESSRPSELEELLSQCVVLSIPERYR
jgi:ubiquinone/menaquinone biosynthesis C-methylase UbiE